MLEERFNELAAILDAETAHLSSASKIINHPAFREIIGMGWPAVIFMLRDLKKGPSLWVWALAEITGVNPVHAADGGNIAKMTEAWLQWADLNCHT